MSQFGWSIRLPPCLPLCLYVSFCWMVCPPSQCLVSLVSSLSPILSTLSSPSLSSFLFSFFGWSIRLPPCLPLCLFLLRFVGWCVRLPNALSPLSPACLPSCLPSRLPACLPSCFPFLDGLSAFPLVSHCVSFCFFLLDGVSAFPMPCLPCLQLVSHLVYPLVSQLVFNLVFLCWMACPSSQGLVSLVSQLVVQLVSLFVSLCGEWSHFEF